MGVRPPHRNEPATTPGSAGAGRGTLQGSVSLTGDGRAVLDGHADRVTVQGIDRWLGGVHLRREAPWRWDPSRQAIVRH